MSDAIQSVTLKPGPRCAEKRRPKTVNAGSAREAELRAAGWVGVDEVVKATPSGPKSPRKAARKG